MMCSDDASDGCESWVVVEEQHGVSVHLGIGLHGLEFIQLEWSSPVAYAFLLVYDVSSSLDPDCDVDEEHREGEEYE